MGAKRIWGLFWLFWFIGGFLLGFGGKLWAKVSGPCSDCHTMHNSQDGSAVVSGGPYRALTKGDCVGCHTGTNTGNSTVGLTNSIPYVLDTTEPTYTFDGDRNILAGGNFYWVGNGTGAIGDAAGHNVVGVANQDQALGTTPPGFKAKYGSKGRDSWNSQVSCAGVDGCHGDPSKGTDDFAAISGAHHTDDTTIDGSTVGTSYRFLLGVKGTEDDDWEFTTSASDHNGYYAVDITDARDSNSAFSPITAYEASINYLCAQCHAQFHAEIDYDNTVGSPWIRHPTDYDMNNLDNSTEYYGYPNPTLFNSVSSAGEYFPDVPVGNTDGAVKSQVLQAAGDAIVLCVSCHRAHASKYADSLRWDYSTCTAGTQSSQCGCFACHTTK